VTAGHERCATAERPSVRAPKSRAAARPRANARRFASGEEATLRAADDRRDVPYVDRHDGKVASHRLLHRSGAALVVGREREDVGRAHVGRDLLLRPSADLLEPDPGVVRTEELHGSGDHVQPLLGAGLTDEEDDSIVLHETQRRTRFRLRDRPEDVKVDACGENRRVRKAEPLPHPLVANDDLVDHPGERPRDGRLPRFEHFDPGVGEHHRDAPLSPCDHARQDIGRVHQVVPTPPQSSSILRQRAWIVDSARATVHELHVDVDAWHAVERPPVARRRFRTGVHRAAATCS